VGLTTLHETAGVINVIKQASKPSISLARLPVSVHDLKTEFNRIDIYFFCSGDKNRLQRQVTQADSPADDGPWYGLSSGAIVSAVVGEDT
jgi:hypothetical protein